MPCLGPKFFMFLAFHIQTSLASVRIPWGDLSRGQNKSEKLLFHEDEIDDKSTSATRQGSTNTDCQSFILLKKKLKLRQVN